MSDTPQTHLVPVDLPGLGHAYLDQSMVPRVHAFIDYAHQHGVELHFNSAYRSPEHQAALHNDPHAITPATHSLHSAGFAVDVNYISLPADQQRVVREAAEAAGLHWGGGFKRTDPPHFYRDPPIDRDAAIAQATRDYAASRNGHVQARPQTGAHEKAHEASHAQAHVAAHATHTDHAVSLHEGAHGVAVHALQERLAALGYRGEHDHALHADSDFGPQTRHALEAFQRAHGLEPDGVAGPRTMAALHATQAAHVTSRIDHPAHADHQLYQQARAQVHALDASVHRAPDQRSDNLAAALAVEAKAEQLRGIHGLVLSDDGSRAFVVDSTQSNDPFRRYAGVDIAAAMNQPVAESSRRLDALQATAPVQGQGVQVQQQNGPHMA